MITTTKGEVGTEMEKPDSNLNRIRNGTRERALHGKSKSKSKSKPKPKSTSTPKPNYTPEVTMCKNKRFKNP